MLCVLNVRGLREATDRLGEPMREIRDGYLLRNLRLGLLSRVDDVRFVLDERPLEAAIGTVDVEALAILPGDVVQEPPDVRGDVGVFHFDMARLNGELVAGLLRDIVAHPAGAEAADVLGPTVEQTQARADDVRGVVHRNHLFPIVRPAVHILRMRGR